MSATLITKTAARTASEKDLQTFLQNAQIAYDEGRPICSDDHYDAILLIFQERFPKNKWGTKVVKRELPKTGVKTLLPYYLPSLDKIKIGDTKGRGKIAAWATKRGGSGTNTKFVVTEKLDGMAGLYHNGEMLYTQGADGVIGRTLTHHMTFMQKNGQLPASTALRGTCIRGELIITKDDFVNYNEAAAASDQETFTIARSFVCGIINKTDAVAHRLALLKFVAYELIEPAGLKPTEQLAHLQKLGFTTPTIQLVPRSKLNDDDCIKMLENIVETSKYECDGIVIASDTVEPRPEVEHNPKHMIAFKVDSPGEETVVIAVEWNVSKYGILVPTVVIKPIDIGGTTVSRASGIHAHNIQSNGIGPGASVRVIKGGDVIPYINEVVAVAPDGPAMPPAGTWRWGPVSPLHGVPINAVQISDSPELQIARIVAFMDKIAVENVSEGTIRKMYNAGLTDLKSIIHATSEQLLDIPGFQTTLANKVVANISAAINRAKRAQIMAGSCLFGTGVGIKKINLILARYPDLDEINSDLPPPAGISEATLEEFCANLELYKEWLTELDLDKKGKGWDETADIIATPFANVKVPKVAKAAAAALIGKTFVFTGFRNKELETQIENVGGKVMDSVSGKTTAVIAADPSENTGKVKKANDKNVPVLSLAQFKLNYGLT